MELTLSLPVVQSVPSVPSVPSREAQCQACSKHAWVPPFTQLCRFLTTCPHLVGPEGAAVSRSLPQETPSLVSKYLTDVDGKLRDSPKHNHILTHRTQEYTAFQGQATL